MVLATLRPLWCFFSVTVWIRDAGLDSYLPPPRLVCTTMSPPLRGQRHDKERRHTLVDRIPTAFLFTSPEYFWAFKFLMFSGSLDSETPPLDLRFSRKQERSRMIDQTSWALVLLMTPALCDCCKFSATTTPQKKLRDPRGTLRTKFF